MGPPPCDEGVVLTKGRVACEMTSADELVATELIFNGTFKELDAVGLGAQVALFHSIRLRF